MYAHHLRAKLKAFKGNEYSRTLQTIILYYKSYVIILDSIRNSIINIGNELTN